MNNKSLYAYFGLLGVHEVDSPGHNFYQLGLIDSIKETYKENKFDFYSYYPDNIKYVPFDVPEGKLGELFKEYFSNLISDYNVKFEFIIKEIINKSYTKLYLKARFRNLSTLTKKWNDASQFELIIEEAIKAGYIASEIIILDTDLSLSENFITTYKDKVTILIPSINFPGISRTFLERCVQINLEEYGDKEKEIMFYGNLDTSNYKHGNSKSDMLAVSLTNILTSFNNIHYQTYIVGKNGTSPLDILGISKDQVIGKSVISIPRSDRYGIWQAMENSLVMLNVTKDKYDERKFIPARIYEAMIFGLIPVSYKFEFLSKTFSFSSILELYEILKYLDGVEHNDWRAAYVNFCNSYLKYAYPDSRINFTISK